MIVMAARSEGKHVPYEREIVLQAESLNRLFKIGQGDMVHLPAETMSDRGMSSQGGA